MSVEDEEESDKGTVTSQELPLNQRKGFKDAAKHHTQSGRYIQLSSQDGDAQHQNAETVDDDPEFGSDDFDDDPELGGGDLKDIFEEDPPARGYVARESMESYSEPRAQSSRRSSSTDSRSPERASPNKRGASPLSNTPAKRSRTQAISDDEDEGDGKVQGSLAFDGLKPAFNRMPQKVRISPSVGRADTDFIFTNSSTPRLLH